MNGIHQFVETVISADAISNYCLQIQDYLRELGFTSRIYARNNLTHESDIVDYRNGVPESDGIIFHHSTYSPLVERVLQLPNKKILIYHNITPPAFFQRYDYKFYKVFREAIRENILFKGKAFEAVVGDSRYNLIQATLFIKKARVKKVIPPFLSLFSPPQSSDGTDEMLQDGNVNILFVGRFVFNKRQDEIIKVFEYYNKFINPRSRLILVGLFSSGDEFCNRVLKLIRDRRIQNIVIPQKIGQRDLLSYYKNADIFLSLSEHEGFCIPILEAIRFKVPVLAYGIPAINELLGKSNVIMTKKIDLIVGLINYTVKNTSFRKRLISRQRKILKRFKEEEIKKRFRYLLKEAFHI